MTPPAPFGVPRFAPPRGSEGPTVALVVAGVVLLAGLVLVGLVAGLVFWGLGMVEDQVEADLRDNPVLKAHVGDITRFEMDFLLSAAEPDAETFVFDVAGAKGSGRITARCVTVDAGHEKVTAGTLRLRSGAVYDLFPPPPAAGAGSP